MLPAAVSAPTIQACWPRFTLNRAPALTVIVSVLSNSSHHVTFWIDFEKATTPAVTVMCDVSSPVTVAFEPAAPVAPVGPVGPLTPGTPSGPSEHSEPG